jgi:UDP-N-acetylglucosamine 4-epimerase
METIGLRYFNVFGPRQDPEGAYAAVIPKWIGSMLRGKQCTIYGDGQTSRDFCFVANAVQANIRAATTTNPKGLNQVYNVAFGKRTSLTELHFILKQNLCELVENLYIEEPLFADFRKGDVLHSLADIEKARTFLGYSDLYAPGRGLEYTSRWFVQSSIGNANGH